MLSLNDPRVKFTLDAVRQAAMLVCQVRSELVSPALTKDDRSPVTVADFASQALIAHLLEIAFPNDLLVAEEDSSALRLPESRQQLDLVTQFISRTLGPLDPAQVCSWIDRGRTENAPRFWTLDPIDGTKGFLRGDQYVVALALVENGCVQLAALGCPGLEDARTPALSGEGSLVIAARHQGAWTTSLTNPSSFRQLRVSDRSNPAEARVLRSFESGHTNVSQIDQFQVELGVQAKPVLMDSQAKYALLSAGEGDILLRLISPSKPDYREKIWDQAAGSLVLEEAGGRITDLNGDNLDFSRGRTLTANRGVLASNGLLHLSALEALKRLGA
jgi:3'(2'), 5'-bisphosphate nucleotidase